MLTKDVYDIQLKTEKPLGLISGFSVYWKVVVKWWFIHLG